MALGPVALPAAEQNPAVKLQPSPALSSQLTEASIDLPEDTVDCGRGVHSTPRSPELAGLPSSHRS